MPKNNHKKAKIRTMITSVLNWFGWKKQTPSDNNDPKKLFAGFYQNLEYYHETFTHEEHWIKEFGKWIHKKDGALFPYKKILDKLIQQLKNICENPNTSHLKILTLKNKIKKLIILLTNNIDIELLKEFLVYSKQDSMKTGKYSPDEYKKMYDDYIRYKLIKKLDLIIEKTKKFLPKETCTSPDESDEPENNTESGTSTSIWNLLKNPILILTVFAVAAAAAKSNSMAQTNNNVDLTEYFDSNPSNSLTSWSLDNNNPAPTFYDENIGNTTFLATNDLMEEPLSGCDTCFNFNNPTEDNILKQNKYFTVQSFGVLNYGSLIPDHINLHSVITGLKIDAAKKVSYVKGIAVTTSQIAERWYRNRPFGSRKKYIAHKNALQVFGFSKNGPKKLHEPTPVCEFIQLARDYIGITYPINEMWSDFYYKTNANMKSSSATDKYGVQKEVIFKVAEYTLFCQRKPKNGKSNIAAQTLASMQKIYGGKTTNKDRQRRIGINYEVLRYIRRWKKYQLDVGKYFQEMMEYLQGLREDEPSKPFPPVTRPGIAGIFPALGSNTIIKSINRNRKKGQLFLKDFYDVTAKSDGIQADFRFTLLDKGSGNYSLIGTFVHAPRDSSGNKTWGINAELEGSDTQYTLVAPKPEAIYGHHVFPIDNAPNKIFLRNKKAIAGTITINENIVNSTKTSLPFPCDVEKSSALEYHGELYTLAKCTDKNIYLNTPTQQILKVNDNNCVVEGAINLGKVAPNPLQSDFYNYDLMMVYFCGNDENGLVIKTMNPDNYMFGKQMPFKHDDSGYSLKTPPTSIDSLVQKYDLPNIGLVDFTFIAFNDKNAVLLSAYPPVFSNPNSSQLNTALIGNLVLGTALLCFVYSCAAVTIFTRLLNCMITKPALIEPQVINEHSTFFPSCSSSAAPNTYYSSPSYVTDSNTSSSDTSSNYSLKI